MRNATSCKYLWFAHQKNVFEFEVSNKKNAFRLNRLVKSKLHEVRNTIEITTGLSTDSFTKFDSVLNICNMIWMEQEELKRKKKAEEDSLYVHK